MFGHFSSPVRSGSLEIRRSFPFRVSRSQRDAVSCDRCRRVNDESLGQTCPGRLLAGNVAFTYSIHFDRYAVAQVTTILNRIDSSVQAVWWSVPSQAQ